ncbi:hypothetical protein SBF1_2860002 [Candidatus Desulfosporosinus infrequens]|uniref:Uncharacterized protein n=1 Tax=Candidatus Desulfosporosinus infrequens TaxID=2043169 RepID=A0A2U3KV72_9FIRM|nr:hypothetical protein SBF1_2860002 [Candidatus Desulfosporosinus infrequens]
MFGKTFFDFYDFATSNVLLLLWGIFIALFVGWHWSYVIVPVAIALMLLAGLNIIHF